MPKEKVVKRGTKWQNFFKGESSMKLTSPYGYVFEPATKDLAHDLLIEQDIDLVDFLKSCLHWNPRKRISARRALNHSFLQGFTKPSSHSLGALKLPPELSEP